MASTGVLPLRAMRRCDGFGFFRVGFEAELAVFGLDVFGGGSVERRLSVGDGELGEFEFGLHGGVVDTGADGGRGR